MDMLPDPGNDGEISNWIATVAGWVGSTAQGLKGHAARNAAKAVSYLCKIPAAWVDAKAAEIKADSDARIRITRATGMALASAVEIDPTLAVIATETHASRILRQQVNSLKVLKQAGECLAESNADTTDDTEEISRDWLNAFECEAMSMSSEHMQHLFGKILAGEIKRPKSYSIRTLKLMAQLDNRAAELFQKFCSLTCTIAFGPTNYDSRVIAIAKAAAQNGLAQYGLSWPELNVLSEYGLVATDYASEMPYSAVIAQDGAPQMMFRYANRDYFLLPQAPIFAENFRVPGVSLSTAGTELLSIVDKTENQEYTEHLTGYFQSYNLTLVQASS